MKEIYTVEYGSYGEGRILELYETLAAAQERQQELDEELAGAGQSSILDTRIVRQAKADKDNETPFPKIVVKQTRDGSWWASYEDKLGMYYGRQGSPIEAAVQLGITLGARGIVRNEEEFEKINFETRGC